MSWEPHSSRVDRAMHAVRREFFVPPAQRRFAEEDVPLPIGWSQTVSQPSLVAYMTEHLELTPQSRVLEIGTGSGYQTAILAELAAEVFTIERLPDLAESARRRLKGFGYRNIFYRIGDGALGWPEAAPFEAILVTAAPEGVPLALVAQLERGGRLVTPLGSVERDSQILVCIKKDREGNLVQHDLCEVRFVPLVSDVRRHL